MAISAWDRFTGILLLHLWYMEGMGAYNKEYLISIAYQMGIPRHASPVENS